MRTLGGRLTLGFWLVALAAVLLAGGGTYLAVRGQFHSLVQSQNRERLAYLQATLADYYAITGSWDGAGGYLAWIGWQGRVAPGMGGPGMRPGMGRGTGGPGFRGGTGPGPAGAANPNPAQSASRVQLLDAGGNVVADSGTGAFVSAGAVELPVVVNGLQVGRVRSESRVALGGAEAGFLRALALACVAAVVGGGVLAAGLGRWASRTVAAPLEQVAAAAQRVAGGELGARVPEPPEAELAQLAGAFNAMAADLQRQQALRQQTLADVTHELRTPVTTVLAHLETMADADRPPEPATVLLLHDEVLRLARLIAELHDVSVAEAGYLRLQRRPVRPADLVRRAVEVFAPAAEGAALQLAVEVPDLPAVNADPDRIIQVLHNLLSNALRYTPAGGQVTIGGRLDGNRAVLTVADTGPGIDPADLPHIFNRFYRADPSRTRASGGSGLGLAIARAVVEAHGGSISAASEPGRGTSIEFALPLAEA